MSAARHRIGLFYGSSTCYTEIAAEKIRDQLNAMLNVDCVDLHNIAETPLALMTSYSLLILGIPTWDYGELQEDWETRWDELQELDFKQATAAIFGLGDQIGYPDWFQDAIGYLWAQLNARGATLAGRWPNRGYQFNASKALTENGDYFLGLALDDENQPHLTDEYIALWCAQLIREFGLVKQSGELPRQNQ